MSKDASSCDHCDAPISDYESKLIVVLSAVETKNRDDIDAVGEWYVCEGCEADLLPVLIPAGKGFEKSEYFETEAYHKARAKAAKDRVWNAILGVINADKAQSKFRAIPNDKKRKMPEAEVPKPPNAKKAKVGEK
jgi:hypothetical protein